MHVQPRAPLLCFLFIARLALPGESPDGPVRKEGTEATAPAAEAPLPPLASIATPAEYLKLTPKLTADEYQQIVARAEKGEALALDLAFFASFFGFGTACDFNQARAWLAKGNRVGAPVCRLYHGRNLLGFFLDGSRRDAVLGEKCLKEAEAFFLPLAQEGNAAAQFFVGATHDTLQKTTMLTWYEKSVAQGFPPAQMNLGYLLVFGSGAKKDVKNGLRLMRLAAEQGVGLAMNSLFNSYRQPETLDPAESLRWLRLAAEKGNPLACSNLGQLYMSGQGIDADQGEAQKWLLKAAEAGFADAMTVLAVRYRDGIGVAADKEEALKWSRRAAALGASGHSYDHVHQNQSEKPCFKLLAKAQALAQQGKHEDAIAAARESLTASQDDLGPGNPNRGYLLHKLGHVYLDAGDLSKAEELHEQAIAFYAPLADTDKLYGLGLADVLMCAAHIDDERGRIARAEERLRKALAILEKQLPNSGHPISCRGRLAGLLLVNHRAVEALALLDEVLASKQDLSRLPVRFQMDFWNSYASSCIQLRRTSEAEKAAQKMMDLVPRLDKANLPMRLKVYRVMGSLYSLKGDYVEARKMSALILKVSEELHGKDHFRLIDPLFHAGISEDDFGRYDLAEQFLRRAHQLCSSQPVAPETVANVTQALAGLLARTGRIAEAETLYQTALQKQKAAEAPSWIVLNNAGAFLTSIGKYQEAEDLLRQALAVAEKQYGLEHAELLRPLGNLADLSRVLGRSREHKAFLERQMDTAIKVYGPDHIETAWVYMGLAALLRKESKYDEAIELQERALTILRRCFGPDGFTTLEFETELAETHIQAGRFALAEANLRKALPIAEGIKGYRLLTVFKERLGRALLGLQRPEEAGRLLQEALDIERERFGTDHPDTGYALSLQACFHAATGQYDRARAAFLEAERIEQMTSRQIGAFSSEEQRVDFAQAQAGTINALLTLCFNQMAEAPAARSAALDLLLRQHGAVLADVQRERLAAREAGDPALAETMTRRQRLAAALSHLTLAGPGNRDPKDYQAQLADLRTQINELEADWARKSAAFGEQTRQQQLSAADLRKVLPTDAAFVQIAAYRQKNFKEVAESKTWGPRQYAALILTKDPESPTLVKLGAADPIEKAIAACRDATQKMTKPGEKTAGDDWLKAASDVRRLVWDPLTVSLKDRRKVYLVPDGELNFVAFGTLPLENGKFLLEEREIALLSNGRDLLREAIASKEGTVLALAAPDFGGIATAQEEVAFARGLFRSHLAGRAGFDRLGAFNPLPGTLTEAKSIEALCKTHARKVEVHTGAEATEARLKSATRPAVLHLATHGFFLPEPDDAKKNDSAVRNALLRSGLALAGANRIVKGEAPPIDQEDGLVTAEEITGLDLWGTKLVVLSACQTALGESRGGEGVFGLRRAFLLAGSEHLVMSLWSVPDQETQELMTEFYKRHLGGASAGRALREAQLEYLRRARAENRSTHPFYWGAFVHTGIGAE